MKLLLDAGAELKRTGYPELFGTTVRGRVGRHAGWCPDAARKGRDRNAKGDGETATMLAAKRGDCEVARLLRVQRKGSGSAPPCAGS